MDRYRILLAATRYMDENTVKKSSGEDDEPGDDRLQHFGKFFDPGLRRFGDCKKQCGQKKVQTEVWRDEVKQ